jgi:hypothetical protein
MPNPVQGFQICAAAADTQGRAGFEEIYDGENNGIQGLIGHCMSDYLAVGLYLL